MAEATTKADQRALGTPEATGDVEDWDDDDSDGDNEGDEDNDGTGAEADEIARRLGDHLWAEISKAQADRVGATAGASNSAASAPALHPRNVSKQEAAIATMKAILAYAEKDPLAQSTFASTLMSDTNGQSVLDFLNRTVTSGTLPKDMAKPLSQVIVSLARSETLFATLRHSNAASIHLDNGKRKREQIDEGDPTAKRSHLPHYDLQSQLVPICREMVSSLRAHQRVHAVHRPFRCTICPASFARNHDLKRHVKLHDRKGWKCGGCDKMFSRRDAIKRHKNSNRLRSGKGEACRDAEIVEVELDNEDGDEVVREERRAKMWSGIAGNPGSGFSGTPASGYQEEGEVQPSVMAQSAVESLQGLLRTHIGGTLGIPSEGSDIDSANGQATLANVIAQAQLQNATRHDQPPGAPSLPPPSPGSMSVNTVDHLATQPPMPSLSLYGLSDEQTKMLEHAIANAASAAQAQAEAEAAMEEEEEAEEEAEDYEEEEEEDNDGDTSH